MRANYKLSIVVPVYNEENNLPSFVTRTVDVMRKLGCAYEIIFAMDPSKDRTRDLILEYRKQNPSIKLLEFSRRFGQPAATMAGIHYCTGDACVVIDADLQDPPELIADMVARWKEGYHVAYAQRMSREGETLIKRLVAYGGYWVIDRIAQVRIPRNTGDFGLLSREVIDQLKELKEGHGFLRGLVGYVGFSQIAVPYSRAPRLSGTGNYNRWLGSLTIGVNGIVGFSRYPLHLISILGLGLSFLSLLTAIVYIVLRLLDYPVVWGNPTLVILVSTLSGIQLFGMGIMGEYVGRIYDEVKQRPPYIVQAAHGFEASRAKAKRPAVRR
jgi:glycosyltransferase involved in cell wall biosynthesis